MPRSPLAAGWAAGLNHRRANTRALLTTFAALRADTLALLRRLSPTQRRAAGKHPEYGRLRVDQLLIDDARGPLTAEAVALPVGA